MDCHIFNKFRDLIYERSGITLHAGKDALLSSRIAKRMRALKIKEHRDYLRFVLHDQTGGEIVQLIDAISTNVTSFFREPEHFDFVQQQVIEWMSSGQSRFRFWSTASSTGEEPYSLAITVQEAVLRATVDVKILATDISTRVLQKCKEGCYVSEKVKTVPKHLRCKYFDTIGRMTNPVYAIKPEIKKMIKFHRLNLAEPPFPMRGPFDMIFCRNVMIYFDNAVRKRLLAEIHRLLRPGGCLLVGHAESLTGIISFFKSIRPAIYIKQ